MNEKINELYWQAVKYANENHPGYGIGKDFLTTSDSIKTLELEKFAEMLIKECIDIISPYTVRMNKPGEIEHPIQEIKKHFGIE